MQMSYLLSVHEESNKQNGQLIYVHVCVWVRNSGEKEKDSSVITLIALKVGLHHFHSFIGWNYQTKRVGTIVHVRLYLCFSPPEYVGKGNNGQL